MTLQRPRTSDEWLDVAELVEEWADEMRADLDANGARTKYEWAAWDLLRSAGGHLRGVAAQVYALEEATGQRATLETEGR